MVMGANGIALIKSFEKWAPKAYKNQGEKYFTIGWGHYGADVKSGQVITVPEGEAYLRKDIASAQAQVNRDVYVPLNQNQFDTLVDFSFNAGNDNFHKSTLLKKVNAKQYTLVPSELLKWFYPIQFKTGLLRRRNAEIKLWNTATTTGNSTPSANNNNTNAQKDAKKKADAKIANDKIIANKKAIEDKKKADIKAQDNLKKAQLTKDKEKIRNAQIQLNLQKAKKPIVKAKTPTTPAEDTKKNISNNKFLKSGFSLIGLLSFMFLYKGYTEGKETLL
jgi:GH24 family phage-related lysozyme (muramidase)